MTKAVYRSINWGLIPVSEGESIVIMTGRHDIGAIVKSLHPGNRQRERERETGLAFLNLKSHPQLLLPQGHTSYTFLNSVPTGNQTCKYMSLWEVILLQPPWWDNQGF